MENQKLEQAIALFKAGNKNEARKLLALLLQEQPSNENAWLWISACVDTESQRVFCLRKVLEINPDNPNAIIMLESLSKKPASEKSQESVHQKLQYMSPASEMGGSLRYAFSSNEQHSASRKGENSPVGRFGCVAEYSFSGLCFKADVIEPLGMDDKFCVITPNDGTFVMSKRQFYETFPKVLESKSYQITRIYHFPKPPRRALQFRISK